MVKKIIFLLSWVGGGLCFASVGFAATYKVELLVFTQTMPNTEVFTQTTSQLKWPEHWLEIATPAVANQNSVLVQPLTGLNQAYSVLAHHPNYSLLLQTAWLQAIDFNQPGPIIHFTSPTNTLNGFISIKGGSALDLQVDAEYTHATDAARFYGKTEQRNLVYRLNEQRAVQINEIQYFDHPAFGIITLITPVTP